MHRSGSESGRGRVQNGLRSGQGLGRGTGSGRERFRLGHGFWSGRKRVQVVVRVQVGRGVQVGGTGGQRRRYWIRGGLSPEKGVAQVLAPDSQRG